MPMAAAPPDPGGGGGTAFDRHTVVLLWRGDQPPVMTEEEGAALQDAHMASQASLHDAGLLVAAGPCLDQSDERLRGFAVLTVGPAEALRLYRDDPAVRAGQLKVEAVTWMVPSGLVAFTPGRLPRSMAEVTGD